MKRQILIYDIETFENLFTVTFYIRKKKEYKYFVIHESSNQYEELLEFLFSEPWIMVGFNNENFDYPVIHHMINHRLDYEQLSGRALAKKIYDKAQALIGEEFTAVWDNNKFIPQIDLYRIFHLDNKARRASLKDIEVAMNLPLVEDMPFDHNAWIYTNQIPDVLSYNENDVYATWQFFELTIGNTEFPQYKGKNKIQLRQEIARRYNLSCMNWNDVKIGEQLILKLYCDTFGYNPKDIKKLKTYRPQIDLKTCIPKWTKFKDPNFKKLITFFENSTIYGLETKNVLSFSLINHGFKFDYGIGGLHGSIKPGIYEEDDEWGIFDWDIDGMYPSLINTQGLYPEHLGPNFNSIYDGQIVQVRLKEKKKPKLERDFVIVEGLKLSANGTYGKLNAEESYLYDPYVAFSTTVSGQICLTMWAERLIEASPDLVILQCNTK